jgi:hypothetical protein
MSLGWMRGRGFVYFSCATLYVNVTFYVSMLLQLSVLPLTFSYLFKQSMLLGLQADMLRDGRDVVGWMEG